jgi:hypothetical protein
MKYVFELILAWLVGAIMPILVYLQLIFWFIVADTILGVWIAKKEGIFSWRKLPDLFGKGLFYAVLLIGFHQAYLNLHIPTVMIGNVEFSIVTFLAGFLAYHEIDSIDKKCRKLFDFSFLDSLKSKFSFLKQFDTDAQSDESNNDRDTK